MLTHLYDLADELNRIAPWIWMSEDQHIGLRHPATGELAHMSLMGAIDVNTCNTATAPLHFLHSGPNYHIDTSAESHH